jgi:hypothetical protein
MMPSLPWNVLVELREMHKQTLQRLDMLVDLQHLILQELKQQAKEKGSE